MEYVSISISESRYHSLLARSEREHRSLDELIEEALKHEEERRTAFRQMGEAIESMQEQAAANGLSEMTMEEIDAEIACVRQEVAARRKRA